MTVVTERDPIAVVTYALRAPESRRQYPRRLKVFFDFLWPGLTLTKQAASFVQTAKKDRPWTEDSFMYILLVSPSLDKDTIGRKKIAF